MALALILCAGASVNEPLFRIEILGGLRIRVAVGPPMDLAQHPAGSLAALLALRLHHPTGREGITSILWPTARSADGSSSLVQALQSLRVLLVELGLDPDEVLMASPQVIRYRPDVVSVDALEFDHLVREAERQIDPSSRRRLLTRAVNHYSGELLSGVYADWADEERSRLALSFRQSATSLVALHEFAGASEEAVATARRGLSVDPRNEELQSMLMRLAGSRAL